MDNDDTISLLLLLMMMMMTMMMLMLMKIAYLKYRLRYQQGSEVTHRPSPKRKSTIKNDN